MSRPSLVDLGKVYFGATVIKSSNGKSSNVIPIGYRQLQPNRSTDYSVVNSNNQATIVETSKTLNESGNVTSNNSTRDIVHITGSQSSTPVTYINQSVNPILNNQKSPAQIIVEAVKILEESHNIKNNYSGNEADKDTKKKELEEKFSELMNLAKQNMMNPKAGFTVEELPLINGIIENQNFAYMIRLCAMSLIYNGVAYHKKQLEESSLDAIVKVLGEDKINSRKIQEYSLILLAKSAQNGQVLGDNILDEVIKFVNSNLAEKAILVFNQAKDYSNISDRIIDELKKIARNLNDR